MMYILIILYFFFFKQKTAYEMRISDWSSDVCSSDLPIFDRDDDGPVIGAHRALQIVDRMGARRRDIRRFVVGERKNEHQQQAREHGDARGDKGGLHPDRKSHV